MDDKQIKENCGETKELIRWENIFHREEKGEMEITVPYHELMRKCERTIDVRIVRLKGEGKIARQELEYKVTSENEVNLSHELNLTPQQL
jgi:hypothetical protein